MQYPLISVQKLENKYVHIYTKSLANDFVQAIKLHHVITVAFSVVVFIFTQFKSIFVVI